MSKNLTFPVKRSTHFMLPDAMFKTRARPTHGGLDFTPVKVGEPEPMYAIEPGVIVMSGFSKNAGNNIMLLGDITGIRWWYGHASSRAVAKGNRVKQGQYIGMTGNTGNVVGSGGKLPGCHLHLEAHYPKIDVEIDPWKWLWDAPDVDGRTTALAKTRAEAVATYGKSTPPTPAPKPGTGPGGIKVGDWLLLKGGWRGYTYSNLTGPQTKLLPTGTYQVSHIDNGSFRVKGHGRDAWVHGVKASQGNPVPAPGTPAPLPPTPAPKPPTKTPAQKEEEELMSAKDEIVKALKDHIDNVSQSRTRADQRGYIHLDLGEDGSLPVEKALHAVYIGSEGILVLQPPVSYGMGQINSIRNGTEASRSDYRWVDQQRPFSPMTSSKFINRVKDSLTMRNYFGDDKQVTPEVARAWIKKHEELKKING